jgi:hypothetical protein
MRDRLTLLMPEPPQRDINVMLDPAFRGIGPSSVTPSHLLLLPPVALQFHLAERFRVKIFPMNISR